MTSIHTPGEGEDLLRWPGPQSCECGDIYPLYGVAPHECYWRKGPECTLGQSTLVPITAADCFVPDLEDDEDWSSFTYPSACGVFYCPTCQRERYEANWKRLVDRIGPPPEDVAPHLHTPDGREA